MSWTTKRIQYLRDRQHARDAYKNTPMSVPQIANLLRRNQQAVHKMIDGKDPAWFLRLIGEKTPDEVLAELEATLRRG